MNPPSTRGRPVGHVAPHALDPTPGAAPRVGFALPSPILARLEAHAALRQTPGARSQILREAVEQWLTRQDAQGVEP